LVGDSDAEGIVLLPDHLHAIWELPRHDSDYFTRWRLIKGRFTRSWLKAGGQNATIGDSRQKRCEQGVLQRRFFEHTCRDDNDLKRCLDYLHINPVRHRLAERVRDWPWSSFHRYVRLGEYSPDSGGSPDWYGDEFADAE
jgi:putative transposase